MARPKKQTVEYFPHYCKCGRTIFILESRFGNDGYAFWFKVLEILGESEGHYYDCSNASNWAFLLAKTHTDEKRADEIIGVLIDLGKIDAELWNTHKFLWVDNFIKNLAPLYGQRKVSLPEKPFLTPRETPSACDNSDGNTPDDDLTEGETAKVKESKVKESKVKKIYPYQGICDLWNTVCSPLPKILKLNDRRRQKIKLRLDEFGVEPEQWLVTAEKLFQRVQASDFLTGRSDGNRNGWTATFDWLFDNSQNWVKVMEGNYDNKGGLSSKGSGQQKLGVGEYIDRTGRRTYGTGRATIPPDAQPRPSERHQWSAETNNWVLL